MAKKIITRIKANAKKVSKSAPVISVPKTVTKNIKGTVKEVIKKVFASDKKTKSKVATPAKIKPVVENKQKAAPAPEVVKIKAGRPRKINIGDMAAPSIEPVVTDGKIVPLKGKTITPVAKDIPKAKDIPQAPKRNPVIIDDSITFSMTKPFNLLNKLIQGQAGLTIQRKTELIYVMSNIDLTAKPQKFECLSIDEAETLWNELNESAKSGIAEIKTMSIPMPTDESEEKANIDGKVTPEDAAKLANTLPPAPAPLALPPAPPAANNSLTPNNKITPPPAPVSSEIIHAYAQSLENAINTSPKAVMQGGMPVAEAREHLVKQTSKEYTYELKESDGKYFIMMSRGSMSVRIPKNENQFLLII